MLREFVPMSEQDAMALCEKCGYLPLGIRVVGGYVTIVLSPVTSVEYTRRPYMQIHVHTAGTDGYQKLRTVSACRLRHVHIPYICFLVSFYEW